MVSSGLRPFDFHDHAFTTVHKHLPVHIHNVSICGCPTCLMGLLEACCAPFYSRVPCQSAATINEPVTYWHYLLGEKNSQASCNWASQHEFSPIAGYVPQAIRVTLKVLFKLFLFVIFWPYFWVLKLANLGSEWKIQTAHLEVPLMANKDFRVISNTIRSAS